MFFKSKKEEPKKEESTTNVDLAIITQMNQDFARSLDLSETLQTALEVIILRMNAQAANIFLIDEKKKVFQCIASKYQAYLEDYEIPLTDGVMGKAVQQKKCIRVGDVRKDTREIAEFYFDLGNLGNKSDIATAKSEIFSGMKAGSTVILNEKDQYFNYLSSKAEKHKLCVLGFYKPKEHIFTKNGLSIQYIHNKDNTDVLLGTFAEHWVDNISGILSIVNCLGLQIKKSCKILSTFSISLGRGGIISLSTINGKITILDESYNAGPGSMKNAINAINNMVNARNDSRAIIILGDMLELGNNSIKYHKDLKNIVLKNNIYKVYCCGKYMKYLYDELPNNLQGGFSETPELLIDLVIDNIQNNDVYLVKGSRGQWAAQGKMSIFVEAFKRLDH